MTSRYLTGRPKKIPRAPAAPTPEVLAFPVGARVWWVINTRHKAHGVVVGYGIKRVRVSVTGQDRVTLVDPDSLRITPPRADP